MTKAQIAKINKLLASPRIARIRQGTGPKIQAATYRTVRDYVIKNKK